MRKIKFITIALAIMFVASFYSSGAVNANYTLSQTTFDIAIVYSTGGLGDQSFNDAAKVGIEASKTTHGTAITVAEACETSCDIPDINAALEAFAAEDKYDLIIGVGFSAGDGINASALAHTSQNFMIIDSVIALPNVNSVVFKEQEGSFLVGAMAGMTTETDKLGFLGGLDIPLINRFGAGFEHGARYINPDITVDVTYSPDPNNPWGDVAGGKSVAESFFEEGIDIVFAAAGGTGGGVFEAAKEANDAATDDSKVYGIGVDSDQDHLSEGNVLCSMLKRVDTAVINDIDDVVSGDWVGGGVTSLGIKEDGVGISPMTYTASEKNADYEDGMTRWEKVQELKTMIADGDITVAENFSQVEDLLPAQTEDNVLPLPVLPTFLAMISVAALIRRRK